MDRRRKGSSRRRGRKRPGPAERSLNEKKNGRFARGNRASDAARQRAASGTSSTLVSSQQTPVRSPRGSASRRRGLYDSVMDVTGLMAFGTPEMARRAQSDGCRRAEETRSPGGRVGIDSYFECGGRVRTKAAQSQVKFWETQVFHSEASREDLWVRRGRRSRRPRARPRRGRWRATATGCTGKRNFVNVSRGSGICRTDRRAENDPSWSSRRDRWKRALERVENNASKTFRGGETHVQAEEATLADVDAEPSDRSDELLNGFLIAEIARFVFVAAKDIGERVHRARSIGDEVDTSKSIQCEGSRVVTPPARAVRNGQLAMHTRTESASRRGVFKSSCTRVINRQTKIFLEHVDDTHICTCKQSENFP